MYTARMTDEHTTVAQLRRMMEEFIAEREWHRFHDPKNLSMSIAIETAELMEHFQWLRSDELPQVRNDPQQMGLISEEVADIFCYLLSLANTLQIDLSTALTGKMAKNRRKYPAEQFKGRFRRSDG